MGGKGTSADLSGNGEAAARPGFKEGLLLPVLPNEDLNLSPIIEEPATIKQSLLDQEA